MESSSAGHSAESDDRVAKILASLRAFGRPGLEAAVRLDLLRSLGVGPAWKRRSDEARLAARARDSGRPAHERIWSGAAAAVGAEVTALGGGFLEIRAGDRRTRVWNHWVPLDDAVTLRFALDKPLVRRVVSDAGLPVTDQVEFEAGDLSPAHAFLERAGLCVVKPADASGGSGTTSGVASLADLRRASIRAGRLSKRLVIEKQISGDVFRLLFLDGRLIDVVRRVRPHVTGDGRSTIAELISLENKRRFEAAGDEPPTLLRMDLDAILTLRNLGLKPSSVPPAGAGVSVKGTVSQNSAAENETVLNEVADDFVEEAARAATAVGLRLAGVDVIASSHDRPPSASSGAILEVNGTPGLHYHYAISNPDQGVAVAVTLLRELLRPT
jgi:D-alanine-D-alanine ligase-like ATP-grasp enzyme